MTTNRYLTAILLMLAALIGCGVSPHTKPATYSSTSTEELVANLPSLVPLGIASCSFAVEITRDDRAMLPAPSDTKVELKGWAVLTESGSKMLNSNYAWKPIPPDEMPQNLRSILPPGQFLVSQKLNESFLPFNRFAHGFVVTSVDGDKNRIYFLARDMDHPIK